MSPFRSCRLAGCLASLACGAAHADDARPADQAFAIHAQATFLEQAHAGFRSPYTGPNSLWPAASGRETFDATMFVGVRPWSGAEIWANPEIDQGFGLSNTLGVAGFPSGEAYKVGKETPYIRLQRLFLRQTIRLSGKTERVDPDLNQLGGSREENRIVLTLGKLAVTDVFDANDYAHDPKHDFLDWALIDTGSFDYAADAWGYTVGGAAEWYQGDWTWRLGAFDLSDIPNSTSLDPHFGQFQLIGEAERRWKFGDRDGVVRLTGFLTRGRMGSYAEALALSEETGQPPAVAAVRRYRSRGGVSLDLQQQVNNQLGVFLRAGVAGGHFEPYEFADIDRTLATGLSLKGKAWGAPQDAVGVGGVVNGISSIHQAYLAAGGLGILVGDGRLPHPGPEEILEAWYDHALSKWLHVALDAQLVDHPAYNRERGPVAIGAVRLHAQF